MIATKVKTSSKVRKEEKLDHILYYTQSLICSERELKKEIALAEIRKAIADKDFYLI
ncbi:MAG: hypothetical protein OEW67_10245 [Cyclobacteriaceae bacterium]|nr:hypothetical protein [Cyclobacteriaceae bacterium]